MEATKDRECVGLDGKPIAVGSRVRSTSGGVGNWHGVSPCKPYTGTVVGIVETTTAGEPVFALLIDRDDGTLGGGSAEHSGAWWAEPARTESL